MNSFNPEFYSLQYSTKLKEMSYLVIVLACFCSMVLGVPVGKRDVSLTWSGEPGDAGQPTPVGGYSQDTSMSMDTPEYVRSLFVNFTKETQSPTHFVQYNTIRSFENVAKGTVSPLYYAIYHYHAVDYCLHCDLFFTCISLIFFPLY